MKGTGRRSYVDEEVIDLDHDINCEVDRLKKQLSEIDFEQTKKNAKSIKKQLIEVILETI